MFWKDIRNCIQTHFKTREKNPIIDSLLGEIEVGKLSDESIKIFLNSSPSVKDLEIKQCLENLKE